MSEAGYPEDKKNFLVDGFRNGFDIGCKGPLIQQDTADNIPIKKGIGNKTVMWNKVMKEVKLGRYAGQFETIPFKNFMQSRIGFVPKADNKT